jgi:hypothetical protein
LSEKKGYKVGYAKPPQQNKFAKGKSGNPKGRPKGSANLATLLRKSSQRRVKVVVNGHKKSVTLLEACVLQLTHKAMAGDVKTILQFLALVKQAAEDEVMDIKPPDLHVHFVSPKGIQLSGETSLPHQ